MVVTGWIASHTGLPSFRVVNDGTTVVRLERDGVSLKRILAGETVIVSDAGAVPGLAHTYTVGDQTLVLTREAGASWDAVFTDHRGRGLPGLIYENNEDPVNWKSDVNQFNRRIARWPLESPPDSGTGMLVLIDPALEAEVWRVCKQRAPVMIGPARPVPGGPMRTVIITDVGRTRIGADGELRFEVAWSEHEATNGGLAPVVTWAEYAAASDGWTHESYEDLCQRIGGMP